MKQILDDYREKGTYVSTAYYMGLLAELYGRQQRFDEALSLTDEALDDSYAEDRHAEPEILRIRGELLEKRGQAEDEELALQSYREALKVADSLGAGGWALKAAVSLSRLLTNNDGRVEAFDTLETVLAKFSPDDKGPDLDAAREFLRTIGTCE